MRQQTIGLVLCALLLTTFGHEHLRAHHLSEQSKLAHHERSRHQIQNRADDAATTIAPSDGGDHCSWVCPEPPSGSINITTNLTLIVNSTTNIVAIVNITAQVAIAFDFQANLVALFNGSSGGVIIYNYQSNTGYYVATSSSFWLAAQGSFELYINSISSLTVVWQTASSTGVSFTRTTVTVIILRAIANILINLSVEYRFQLSVQYSGSLDLLIQISGTISGYFRGSLSGFLQLAGSGVVIFRGGLVAFIGVLAGLAEFFARIQGGIQALIQRSVEITWSGILGVESGIQVFIYLVRQISIRASGALSGIFSANYESFFAILVGLSRSTSAGYSGFIQVIYSLVAAINRRGSIAVFIDALVNYSVSRSSETNITAEFYSSIDILANYTSSLNSSVVSSSFTQLLVSIREQRWIVAGVSISRVIEILGSSQTSLNLVIAVFYQIRRVIRLEVTIAQFLLNTFVSLNSTSGIAVINSLFVDLHLNISSNETLVAYIASRIDYSRILQAGFNLERILLAIPVIGQIYSAVSAAVSSQSNGSFKISVIFTSSYSVTIVRGIWAWLASSFRIKVGGGLVWSSGEDKHKSIEHARHLGGVHARHLAHNH